MLGLISKFQNNGGARRAKLEVNINKDRRGLGKKSKEKYGNEEPPEEKIEQRSERALVIWTNV